MHVVSLKRGAELFFFINKPVFTFCPHHHHPPSTIHHLPPPRKRKPAMVGAQTHSVSASIPSAFSSHLAQLPVPSFFPAEAKSATWVYTTAVVILSLLALEQGIYRYKKSHLPGSKWTIPIIGKFKDSLNPTLEGYMKQWESGALSALSVFNMYDTSHDRILHPFS